MSRTTELQARWDAVMMRNYGTPPLAISSGSGSWVTDADGRRYLDLVAGIAVSSVGHCHPAVRDAIAEQAGRLIHSSNLAINEPALALAERLVSVLEVPARVFFCQDGATANEAAYKIVRRHPEGRSRIIAMVGSFHGRTMGALSVTGNPAKRVPFEPLPGPVDFVPFGDETALAEAISPDTAAVFVEPVQGENGVVVPPPEYLMQVRRICDDAGAWLVVDEVQSGIGRTGSWFATTAAGVIPEVMTLAKGLAGGMPLGACLATGAAAQALQPGDHGSTFGGNPVSAAASLAVLDIIEEEGLLEHVREQGQRLTVSFDRLVGNGITAHRGVGLWRALVLPAQNAASVELAARDAGFLVNAVRPDTIRLAPALNIPQAELDTFCAELPEILGAAA
ncbi:MAG: acetylornithine transaminase [Actinobacteria bacterium]|nr:acetylornithine transaminase [Actinomycetota bacterium]